jgi:hypothetical protein
MATQEILHVRTEKEMHINHSRPGQHHNKSHQRPTRTANFKVSEVTPLCGVLDYAE